MKNDHSHKDFEYAKNADIEIRVDLDRVETPIEYRFLDDFTGEGWQASPYHSYQCIDAENALRLVNDWLEAQY